MRICTESTPARGSSPEGSFAKDLLRNRRKTSSGIKNLECLTYHTRQKKSQKETEPSPPFPGLSPLLAPRPPPLYLLTLVTQRTPGARDCRSDGGNLRA